MILMGESQNVVVNYSSSEICRTDKPNSQVDIKRSRKCSVSYLLISYLDLKLDVVKSADISRYGNGIDVRITNLGPTVLSTLYKLTTSCWKHLRDFSHAHIVSSLHRTLKNAKDTDDLSTGFDRGHVGR